MRYRQGLYSFEPNILRQGNPLKALAIYLPVLYRPWTCQLPTIL